MNCHGVHVGECTKFSAALQETPIYPTCHSTDYLDSRPLAANNSCSIAAKRSVSNYVRSWFPHGDVVWLVPDLPKLNESRIPGGDGFYEFEKSLVRVVARSRSDPIAI